MGNIAVTIKRLPGNEDIPLPEYQSGGASGMDIRACVRDPVILNAGEIRMIPTGLAISVPPGYEAQIRPRSGLALHHGIGMANSPGTVDSDYRGEIGIILVNWGRKPFRVGRGDRIAQMVVCKICRAEWEVVEDLDESPRGSGGFGHTGAS